MRHPFSDFNELYERGLERSEMNEATLRRPRFYNLVQFFSLSRGIPGDTAEVGCFRGLSSFLLCHAARTVKPDFAGEGHHIIDSFEGLSAPTKEDDLDERMQGRFSDTSVEHVRRTLGEFPNVNIIKGWVPQAFSLLPELNYRFVHIDVDLYNPTRACLEYFYPRVARGGVIVVDDFGPWPQGGKYVGCTRAVTGFCEANDIRFAAINTGNAVIIKR